MSGVSGGTTLASENAYHHTCPPTGWSQDQALQSEADPRRLLPGDESADRLLSDAVVCEQFPDALGIRRSDPLVDRLRQTVIAMVHGSELSEHENPGEATVLVLRGRVRLSAGELAWEGSRGDLIIVPDARHRLTALEDSAVLLTVAKLL